jgi:hypothetical protein
VEFANYRIKSIKRSRREESLELIPDVRKSMVQASQFSEALALFREARLESHLDGVMQQVPRRGIQPRIQGVATSDPIIDRRGNEKDIGIVHIDLSSIRCLRVLGATPKFWKSKGSRSILGRSDFRLGRKARSA